MTMTTEQTITVKCPRCEIIIERVTAATMVYCLACQKWCRELEEQGAVKCATLEKIRDGHCC